MCYKPEFKLENDLSEIGIGVRYSFFVPKNKICKFIFHVDLPMRKTFFLLLEKNMNARACQRKIFFEKIFFYCVCN